MNNGQSNGQHRKEVATLGGGCFWCIEAIYNDLKGVSSAISGYSGGHVKNPTYRQVCTDTTGHAEVVQIEFDPDLISYRDILDIFFSIHDPTTLNRQGADVGEQYRSVIFYHSPEQKRIAEETIKELTDAHAFRDGIVTQIVPFEEFYPAEDYHQEYFKNNPGQPYCRVVIAPKVSKFRKSHAELLKA
ncbi:MAG TPA: peptide-methionine (S)-S-oxide reductase MsrA [Anaerolineae bacterium]|nr:peptide-methionine (S)-S-oxide reductase MsrA [Anaerolineae bacterium]